MDEMERLLAYRRLLGLPTMMACLYETLWTKAARRGDGESEARLKKQKRYWDRRKR